MPNKLFTSIGFPICGMVFLILVFIMYMSKKKFKTFENGIFIHMFITIFLLLINEFVYVYAMYAELDAKISFLSTRPFCYSYILLCIVWFSLLIMYVWSKLYNNIDQSIAKKKRRWMSAFMVVWIILLFSISCILKIEYPAGNSHLYVFSGPAVYVLYIIGMISLALLSVFVFVRGKNIPSYQKTPIFFCIAILIIINSVQLVFDYDFNSLSYLFVFVITTLYFTIESQDYKLIDELERKRTESEFADKAQTEFLANMSHEIRTPLNTILGFSDSLLSESNLTEEIVNRDVSMIYEASNSLLDLINKILAVSKIESGKEQVIEEKYDLHDLVINLEKEMTIKTDKRDIKFKVEMIPNMPTGYIGDFNKIYNTLLYILENTLKYTDVGTLSLKIYSGKVDKNSTELIFKMLNVGTNMSSDVFNISFKDFVKLGDKNQNTIDSLSLGLIIAKDYISMLGGSVEFASDDVNKTQYIIKVNQKIDNQIEELKDYSDKDALIISNDFGNLEKNLTKLNFRVDVSDNTESINNKNYDVIFIDNRYLNINSINDIKDKVVLLIYNSDDFNGFNNVLVKPVSEEDLEKVLENMFK